MENNPFGDYRPNLTPDTIFDYNYLIKGKITLIRIPPNPKASDLTVPLEGLKHIQKQAKKYSRTYQSGKIVLGTCPEEYNFSDEVLIESHIGEIIMELLQNSSAKDFAPFATFKKNFQKFRKVIITHID
jgi:hypothetical protein